MNLSRSLSQWTLATAATLSLLACEGKSGSSSDHASAGGHPAGPFDDEPAYLVATVATHIASFSEFGALDVTKSPTGYEVGARGMDAPIALSPAPCVWSPPAYHELCRRLLASGSPASPPDASLRVGLLESSPGALAAAAASVGARLRANPGDATAHEEAALVLVALGLREAAGWCYDTRATLGKVTAHLAMAGVLRAESSPPSVNGALADIGLDALAGRQVTALANLQTLWPTTPTDESEAAWERVLRTRITADWRMLDDRLDAATPMERFEWLRAKSDRTDPDLPFDQLTEHISEGTTIPGTYLCIAAEESQGVGLGHLVMGPGLVFVALEAAEALGLEGVTPENVGDRFEEVAEAIETACREPRVAVSVLSPGDWARYYERHLCHLGIESLYHIREMWDSPDDEGTWKSETRPLFESLPLFRIVGWYWADSPKGFEKSARRAAALMDAIPEAIPSRLWTELSNGLDDVGRGSPPSTGQWFTDPMITDTAYNVSNRARLPAIRGSWLRSMESYHAIAPYDRFSAYEIVENWRGGPTVEAVAETYGTTADYDEDALTFAADAARENDDLRTYEKWMEKRCTIDPSGWHLLGDHLVLSGQWELAQEAYENSYERSANIVQVSNTSSWLMHRYLAIGDTRAAKEIADFGAEVYSRQGLATASKFYELAGDLDRAFTLGNAILDRYGNDGTLIDLVLRHPDYLADDDEFGMAVAEMRDRIFAPAGPYTKVTLAEFTDPPRSGAQFRENSFKLKYFPIGPGDIIVALDGYRTESVDQYLFVRRLSSIPRLTIIYWDGSGYHELLCELPDDRQFGADMRDYRR